MDTATSLARLLRCLRDSHGLTQRELAYFSGIDQRRISSYERGRRTVPLAHADRLLAGMGLQLRLETEELWADVDAKIDKLAATPLSDRLAEGRVRIISILDWFADVDPIVDGRAAALLQGAPIPVDWLELCVRRDQLDALAELMRTKPPGRWCEAKGWWTDAGTDPREPGPMRWHNYLGEFRLTVVDVEPPAIAVVITDAERGEMSLRVRPLSDVEVGDPETARLLARVRARRAAGGGPGRGGPAGSSPPEGGGPAE